MLTKRALTALLLATCLGQSGCYYSHVTAGQLRLLLDRRPTAEVLADPATPSELRERLALVERTLAFADGIGLEAGNHYRSFVDRPGFSLVTSVVATRPGEIEAAGFWFPVVGRVPYKGFFDPARAEREAEKLRERGLDVCITPIVAYSTLGWFDDPLTGPMLRLDPGRLTETVLHELVHATIFVGGNAEFDEGIASFVGQEAAVRFAAQESGADSPAARAARARVADDRAIALELTEFRSAVKALYAEALDAAEREARRGVLEAEWRLRLEALPLASDAGRQRRARVRLNDACQALTGTYEADLPGYAARLDALDDDLVMFLVAARAAAASDDPRRTLLDPKSSIP